MCYFVLVFFGPFSIAITSLGEERANLSAFRTFVRFALVWFCLFSFPLGVWEGLRLVIVAFPGLFSYLFFVCILFLLVLVSWNMCKKSPHFISPLSAKRIIGGRYQTGKSSPDVSGIVRDCSSCSADTLVNKWPESINQ